MQKLLFVLLAMIFLSMSCGGGSKKQGLTDEPQAEENKITAIYEAEEVLDTIIPSPGIRYRGTRAVDTSNPPVRLNLANTGKEDRNLDVADYYSTVRYVKLKHPLPAEKGEFLGDASIHTYYEQGSSSSRGYNSRIYVTNDKIIAGDDFFGYHCYDRDGKFEYTIAERNQLPDYNRKSRNVTVNWDKSLRMVHSLSVLGDNCIFSISENGKYKMYFQNLKTRKNYLERPPLRGELRLLAPTTLTSYFYWIHNDNSQPFFGSCDYKGEILCLFRNNNPVVKQQKKAAPNPDSRFLYYYNDQLTVRQAYNDTIYRMVSEQRLLPVYVMDFGNRKMDGETALYGDKSDKLVPYTWVETSDFVFIMYTQNYDCPNNRNNGSVIFNYAYYDKATKKLYNIPSHKLPEKFFISNSIDGGIPLIGNNMYANGGLLYIGYTKYQLESIINQPDFALLLQDQQDNLKAQYDGLDDQEMLVVILEK